MLKIDYKLHPCTYDQILMKVKSSYVSCHVATSKFVIILTVYNAPYIGRVLFDTTYGENVGTPNLHSSLDTCNREFACPRETVAITCNVNGTTLRWEAQESDDEPVQIETLNTIVMMLDQVFPDKGNSAAMVG